MLWYPEGRRELFESVEVKKAVSHKCAICFKLLFCKRQKKTKRVRHKQPSEYQCSHKQHNTEFNHGINHWSINTVIPTFHEFVFDSVAAITLFLRLKTGILNYEAKLLNLEPRHIRPCKHSFPHAWSFPRRHLISPQFPPITTQSGCSFVTHCLFVQSIVETGLCKPVPLCHLGDSAYSFRRSDVCGAWIITIGASNAHLPWINADLSCSAALHSFALVQLWGFYFIHRRVTR